MAYQGYPFLYQPAPAFPPVFEILDPSFMVHPNDFFQIGRMFMTLYSDTAASGASRNTAASSRRLTRGAFGEQVYQDIVRMVVVKVYHHHCICLPVHTYSYRATLAPNVDPTTHAVIYMRGAYSPPLYAENIVRDPIEVLPLRPDIQLHARSRINFSNPHTIHHNVKVSPLGQVSEESLGRLLAYWGESALSY